MPIIQNKVTVSAGGVVINQESQVLLVNQRGSSWSLPKGHVDPGEEPLAAAKREILEETGISELKLIETLGAYGRYKIGQNVAEDKTEWKVLLFFLFKTTQKTLKPQDPHNPEARWVQPDRVESLLTHSKDKTFFRSILSQINESA